MLKPGEKMSKRNYVLVLLMLLSLAGCRFYGVKGNGDIERDVRDLDQFSKVDISGAYDVEIVVGNENRIEIETDENLIGFIKTKVRGSRLIIENKKSLAPTEGIIIKITAESLEEIETSGASTIYANMIDSDIFRLDFSGAGSIYLEGDCSTFLVDMSGAGSLNAKKLIANEVQVNLSGASSAKVFASESLEAEVSGVGTINYYGDPEDIRTDISGVGSINPR